jgi:hypothetical protein
LECNFFPFHRLTCALCTHHTNKPWHVIMETYFPKPKNNGHPTRKACNPKTQTRATYTTLLRVKKKMCCSGASAALNSSVLKRGPSHLHRTVRLGLMDKRGGSGWAFWPSNRLILRQPSHSTLELEIATWIKIAAHVHDCPLH